MADAPHPERPHTLAVVAAIASVTILESIALLRGVDGALFGLALVVVGGLGGASVAELVRLVRR